MSSRSISGASSFRRSTRRTSTRWAGWCFPSPDAFRLVASWCAIRAASSSRCSRPIHAVSRNFASMSRLSPARPRAPLRSPKASRPDAAAPRAFRSPLEGAAGRATVTRAATWVASLSGWRRACFAVLLGALSVLAFAPFHLWPVLFLTFGPLVWLLDGCYRDHAGLAPRLKCASLIGFWFGFGYFLAGLYWVAEAFLVEPWRHGWLIPFVMTAFPAGMALFFVAASALAMLMWRPGIGRVFALAIAFGLAEYARGHVLTGFPWNLIGYAPLGNVGMMQLASLFGVYALSLLAVLLFVGPAAIFTPADSPCTRSRATILLTGVLLIALGVGGLWGNRRLANAESAGTGIRVRI